MKMFKVEGYYKGRVTLYTQAHDWEHAKKIFDNAQEDEQHIDEPNKIEFKDKNIVEEVRIEKKEPTHG